MEIPIPRTWLDPVLRILDRGDWRVIEITRRAQIDWEATFPAAFPTDLLDALEEALAEPGVTGRLIPGSGETWAFWFQHERRRLYGKISLRSNLLSIQIISAHRPLKGEDSL